MRGLRFSAAVFIAALFVCAFGFFSVPSVLGSNNFRFEQIFAVPPAIQLQQIATGVSSPVYVTNVGDSRLFVVEQTGQIRIFQNGSFLGTPFLNLTSPSLVNCCGERGLLGLAFHPNYPATPYFYVHFTSNGAVLPDLTDPANGDNVIVRYTVPSGTPNVADAASAKTLLVIPNPNSNHNGGMLEFGGDGYLYIGKGDGGSSNDPQNRAQNINDLLGKILRLDVNQNINAAPWHGIPSSNPFVGTAGADEIFLVGMRNPWRFSFDRTTGDLWIGDVGQGAREEIDRLPIDAAAPGKNFGWRVWEGTNCTGLDPCVFPANYVAPVAEYSHSGGKCSITGGYVYRGTLIPALVGSYVYADYCTGEIFRLNGTTPELMLDTSHNISSFGEDNSRELYITALSGTILRIESVPSAASAIVSGRITNTDGRGVGSVYLEMSGGQLSEPRYARTNPFGYYQFAAAEAGVSYIITPTAKRLSFTPLSHVITLLDDLSDVDFVATTAGLR